jgi:hypothetical protein
LRRLDRNMLTRNAPQPVDEPQHARLEVRHSQHLD